MAASAGPALRKLHEELGEQVRFLSLYVRETHPGERMPQTGDVAEKLARARLYRDRDAIPWPVAVDDLDGGLHRQLGGTSGMVLLYDRDGRLARHGLMGSDERGIRRALTDLIEGRDGPIGGRRGVLVPLLRALGMMDEVAGEGGKSARRDLLKLAAPVYGVAKLARMLPRRFSPLQRSLVALAAAAGAVAAGAIVVRRLATRTGGGE